LWCVVLITGGSQQPGFLQSGSTGVSYSTFMAAVRARCPYPAPEAHLLSCLRESPRP
jgi:hypothetical protein